MRIDVAVKSFRARPTARSNPWHFGYNHKDAHQSTEAYQRKMIRLLTSYTPFVSSMIPSAINASLPLSHIIFL